MLASYLNKGLQRNWIKKVLILPLTVFLKAKKGRLPLPAVDVTQLPVYVNIYILKNPFQQLKLNIHIVWDG